MRTQTKEIQQGLTPEKAFEILKEGNRRFVSNLRYNRNLLQQVNEIRGNIRATMRKTLHNGSIELTLRLAEPSEMKRVYTKRELFDHLRQNNPAIEKLRAALSLELA